MRSNAIPTQRTVDGVYIEFEFRLTKNTPSHCNNRGFFFRFNSEEKTKIHCKPVTYILYAIYVLKILCFCLFQQCLESEQQLGSAVRVHVPRSGANERETGTHESLDFDQETEHNIKTRIIYYII